MTKKEYPLIPLDHKCNVLQFENPGIWAFEKGCGILSHPNKESKKGGRPRTLLNADYNHQDECYRWIDKEGNSQSLYLVHRLDSPTSGIIIGATSEDIAFQIKELLAKKEVKKTYFALIRPHGSIRQGLWKDNLKEKKEGGKIRVWKGNGSTAITNASIERQRSGLNGVAMLRLEPKTGRTHQLRVQCALRGMPIIGDKTYGDFNFNRKIARASKVDRLCLHAGEIEFSIKINNKKTHFFADSPLPRSMGKLLY
jgi:23S rRNA-/tRNA-specific pseudouridylate synthase